MSFGYNKVKPLIESSNLEINKLKHTTKPNKMQNTSKIDNLDK